MAKVTFEFDAIEDKQDINLVNNRNNLVCALYELQNYRRELYKYIEPDILVRDGKIVENSKTFEELERTTGYIEIDKVIDKIDEILSEINYLLEE